MSLSRVAARRDLAPMLVSACDGMLVRLLLDVSEESNSRGGLWRQALRVLALLAAFARDFFVSEPGEFYGSLAQPEASPRAHLGSSKSDDLAERPTGGDITGEPIIEETGRMTSGQAKISSEDRLRVLFGMKRSPRLLHPCPSPLPPPFTPPPLCTRTQTSDCFLTGY